MQCWVSAFLLVLCSSRVLFGGGSPEVAPELCQIEVEKKIKDGIPPVPDFLLIRRDTERCIDKQNDFVERDRVECAGSFIRPECICSYHQVSNKIYHNYTACADNSRRDSIYHLFCEQCKKYSENKNGPCLNDGNLLCKGDTLVNEASCNCSESFSGKFCETKTVPTYRTCFLNLDILSTQNISVCGENILENCKVVNGSATFECTLDFTEERKYPDCASLYKNAANVAPELCQIEVEKKIKDGIPPVPDFLLIRRDTERCIDKQNDFVERDRVECAGSFIRPECICSYHQVSNKIYHNYTACAANPRIDSINHLSCEQCKKYSKNKNGPCLNGGNLLCKGDTLVNEASCNCSESFSGKFCETKTVPTYRTCFLNLDILSTQNIAVCGENILEKCKVVNGSATFECTLDFTEERKYPDCASLYKNAANGVNVAYELCQIEVEKKRKYGIPPVPDFLLIRWDTERCRDKQNDFIKRDRVECSGSFIRPECICTFHQVSNRIYHNYTACPDNSRIDSINHLSCEQCKKYSENKNGPCLNGGNLLCKGDTLVNEASCNCSESFSGKFCETKTVPTYRTCFLNLHILSTQYISVCGENILENCKVVNGSATFECTLDFTEERKYPDCASLYKNAANGMKSNATVINCGSIQSASLKIIFYACCL